MVHEVDEKALDVRAVLILICHDHQFAVSQVLQGVWVVVLLLELQTHDFDDVVDFSIVHDLN